MKAAAIILTGGKSRRMGQNKALLKINEQTNVERIRNTLQGDFEEILLVTNEAKPYEFLQMETISDHYPGMGPLAGLHAGLVASTCDINVLVACDMPFVSAELAKVLVEQCRIYDAVVPVIQGKQHPLFAAYKKSMADKAARCIEEGNLRMKQFLAQLNVCFLTEKDLENVCSVDIERVFYNMNHPDEYETAKKWAEA